MLGPPKTRDLDRPVLISVESYVPKDHLFRYLHRVLDLSFVRDLVADCYASGVRPSIDPEVFFRLHLIMFFSGIRSERQLLEQAEYNLAMRWYAGYNLDKPLPDHSSLSKIRTRLGLPVFRRFFDAITEQCIKAGLVWGEELIFDAAKVRANAAMDSLIPRLHLLTEEHLASLERQGPPTTLADMNDARWDVLDECRLDPERPSSGGYERKSDRLVSTTDPGAVAMKTSGQKTALGFHDHYVIDGGRARIILHAMVTPADVMENQPMLAMRRRVMFRWRVKPKRVIADTTYGTAENIREIEKDGIRAYTPWRTGTGAPITTAPRSSPTIPSRISIAVRRARRCAGKRPSTPSGSSSIAPRRRSATPARSKRPAPRVSMDARSRAPSMPTTSTGCAATTRPQRTRRRCTNAGSGSSRSLRKRRTGTAYAGSGCGDW